MSEPTFTEAPASVNLKFDYRGYQGVMLTLRAETGQDVLSKLDGAISHLEKIGATPAVNGYGQAATNSNAPECPVHHKPMKRSQHFSGWYCPKKNGDGYCKEQVKD